MVAWFVKLLVWAGWIVGSMFIPNYVFYVYAWISVFGAGIFVLIQLVLLIEFAYEWNESWVAKWHGDTMEENKKWFVLLMTASIVLFVGGLTLTVLLYVFYTGGSLGQLNTFFITFNMLLCIIVCVCSILPKVQEFNPRSGLLQGAVISLYATYLVWSAISSEPSVTSTQTQTMTPAQQATTIIGSLLVFVAVVYSATRAGSSADELKGRVHTSGSLDSPTGESGTPLLSVKRDEEAGRASDDSEDSDAPVDVEYNYTFFHLSFVMGAMYIGMLMTNWSVIGGDGSTLNIDSGMASVWVKIATGWIAILLYGWTIFAPKILADRDFS